MVNKSTWNLLVLSKIEIYYTVQVELDKKYAAIVVRKNHSSIKHQYSSDLITDPILFSMVYEHRTF